MTPARRVAVALFTPLFALGFGLVIVICALDRLLRPPLPFPRDVRGLARRRAWCVRVLRAAGALPADAVITGYEVTPFKRGEAFRSALARVVVTYTRGEEAGRFECVAKFAPAGGSLANRAVFVLQKLHTNEVGFYRHVTAEGDPLAPRAWYARAAALTGNFCVLLELIEDAVEHSEERGCPLDAAHVAVRALARLHARHWGTRAPFPPRIVPFTIDFACSLAWGRRRRVLRHLARASWHHGNTPQTLIHGDARVGNMLFSSGAPEATLIDWQAVRWGRGAFDLAYFVLLSLESATREAHQEALIAAYHAELVAGGVADYDVASLREDYQHSLVLVGSLLVVPLLGGEVTVDDANAARILSGALVWNQRLVRALALIDTDWLHARYGVDAATLRETVAYSARHPPRLNRGACLVADHLARTGSAPTAE